MDLFGDPGELGEKHCLASSDFLLKSILVSIWSETFYTFAYWIDKNFKNFIYKEDAKSMSLMWEKLSYHKFGNFQRNHSFSNRHDLKVFSALSCCVLVESSRTTQAAFIGRNTDANSWSTDQNSPVLWFYLLGKFFCKQRVVARYFFVSTYVKHFVFKATQVFL